jgi:outer membrane lipoprotein SlyB
VAGHEISDHTGGSRGNKNIAAAAGAVGGALAGNQIQKNVTSDTYDISVRMDDGRTIVVNQRTSAASARTPTCAWSTAVILR